MKKAKVTKTHLTKIRKLFPKVTKVVDATEPLTVEVRERDNKRGTIKHPGDCAMARACKRVLGLDGAIISLSKAYLILGNTATRYNVPQSLSKEVVVFDRSKTFEPGTYQFSAVPASRKLGNESRAPHKAKGGKRGPVTLSHHTTGVRKFYDRPGTEQEVVE
jgi:hypothetical protein